MLNLLSPQWHNYSTIFKTTLKDINNIAVAIDKISTMTLPDYIGLGSAIDGLSAKQAALVLSTRNLSQAELEEVVIQNNLLATYGAEELIKAGLLTTNSSLLNSEKAVSAEKLANKILQSSLNKEEAKEFIQKQLIVTANNEESASTVLLNKALMDEAVKRGVLSEEKAAEILSTYGVVTADTAEIASKKSLIATIIAQTKAKIAATAAAHPLAVGITAIVAATYGAIKASEAWSNRLKKQAQESSNAYKGTLEEIESINSELQSNSQRIDELNAKENLTLIEAEELEKLQKSNRELENTLALKEKIAQQEKAEANKDAVKYFKEDTHTYNNETGKYSSTHIEVATQYLDEIYKKEQRIHELELEMSRTDANTEKYRELSGELDMTQKSYEDLLQRVQDYNDVFTNLDDNLFEGKDDEYIQQLETFYKRMNEVLHGVAETNTNAIRDILAKADFQSTAKQLEELGKSGELSVTTLSSRFPELIDYLDEAGISAQELYQYIMALSNPDAINYAEVERQFKQSLGIRDGEINGASDQKIWNEIKDSFSKDEWQIALEAYLKVRDQYGEHPEGWTAKDWVANIQSELETEIVEINAKLSISETIDQLNTRLKPAFDSLQSAWKDIFTDDGFALNSIDILSTCDSIKSKLDEMSELGLDVDYSAFEDFVRVLRNTESTEEDVRNAFDSLATSITQAGLSGTEDFETMKAALEDLGVVNETIVAFQALAENTEALKESGLDLVNATYAQLEAFAQEKLGAEDAAQGVAILVYQQMLVAENPLNTMASIQALANLGGKAAETAAILAELAQIMAQISNLQTWMANNPGADTSLVEATLGGLERKAERLKSQIYTGVDFENVGGGTSKAGSAGSKAGDAYVDAYEEELKELETLRDQGKITEKQYLDYLRKLYEKYFKNIDKYAKNFAENQAKYLQGMKSLYESALSGITSILDKQISAYEDSKNAAVSTLEAERDAAIEAKEAEKEQLEEKIDLINKEIEQKEKVIDGINDEIDAIKDANDERQRQLDLQKAQYELARMQNQRTILQYSSDKGMHYVTDTSGIRDAKDKVDDAQTEIKIANKEKEIKLIEKEIDLLEERKDAINEQIDLLV